MMNRNWGDWKKQRNQQGGWWSDLWGKVRNGIDMWGRQANQQLAMQARADPKQAQETVNKAWTRAGQLWEKLSDKADPMLVKAKDTVMGLQKIYAATEQKVAKTLLENKVVQNLKNGVKDLGAATKKTGEKVAEAASNAAREVGPAMGKIQRLNWQRQRKANRTVGKMMREMSMEMQGAKREMRQWMWKYNNDKYRSGV